jgi:hypothetical protein
LAEEGVTLQNEISRLTALNTEQRVDFETQLSELRATISLFQSEGVGVSELESEISRLQTEISWIREESIAREKSVNEEKADYERQLEQLRDVASHHSSSDDQKLSSPSLEFLSQLRETSSLIGEMIQLSSPALLESEPIDFFISPQSDSETQLSFFQRNLLFFRLSLERNETESTHQLHHQLQDTTHQLEECTHQLRDYEQQCQEMNETIEYQQKKIESLKTNKKNLLDELRELRETLETIQDSTGDGPGGVSSGNGNGNGREGEDGSEKYLKEIEILKRQLTETNQSNEKYVSELEQMVDHLQSENFDLKSYSNTTLAAPHNTNGGPHTNGSGYPHSSSPSPPPTTPSVSSANHGLTPDLEDLLDNMTMKIKKLESQLTASKKQESSQILFSQQLEQQRSVLSVRCEELESGMRALVETSERQEGRISELLDEIDRLEAIVQHESRSRSRSGGGGGGGGGGAKQQLTEPVREELEEEFDKLQGSLVSSFKPLLSVIEERDHLLYVSHEAQQTIQDREGRIQQLEEVYEQEKRSFLIENEGLQKRIDVRSSLSPSLTTPCLSPLLLICRSWSPRRRN